MKILQCSLLGRTRVQAFRRDRPLFARMNHSNAVDSSKTVALWCYGTGSNKYVPWTQSYLDEFRRQRPQWDLRVWPFDLQEDPPTSIDLEAPFVKDLTKGVELAVVWSPPVGLLNMCDRLRLISIMGAGKDGLATPELVNTLPQNIPITRLIDTTAAKRMSHHVLMHCLNIVGMSDLFQKNQREKKWDNSMMGNYKEVDQVTVGVMGLGAFGTTVADMLKQVGFNVIGWKKRSEISHPSSISLYEVGRDSLQTFLQQCQILVVVLPLNQETTEIINYDLLKQLPKGAHFINVARGKLVVEKDLLKCLDEDHLAGAVLDVLSEEPPPQDSVFWHHPKVKLTPHITGLALAANSVSTIIKNWEEFQQGKPLRNIVNLNE